MQLSTLLALLASLLIIHVCGFGDRVAPSGLTGVTFGMLLDAGSTGTRVNIYSWDTRIFATSPPNLTMPLELSHLDSSKTSPGIDKPEGRVALVSLLRYLFVCF